MKYKTHIILIAFLTISTCYNTLALSKTMYEYNGGGSENQINFRYDVTITLSGTLTGQLTIPSVEGVEKCIYMEHLLPDAMITNSLVNVNRTISTSSPKVSLTTIDTNIDDYVQSNYFVNVAPGLNSDLITFSVYYNNISSLVTLNNGVTSQQGTFPVVKANLPASVLKYLDATSLVHSTNTSIKNTAQSITSGCTDFRSAIIKLSQWIESYVAGSNNNPSNSSIDVYDDKIGDCDGTSHLLAAFCRSLNIPARVVSGWYIEHPIIYPITKDFSSFYTFGSGNGTVIGGHTECEIYVPQMNNWVRCDPGQRTTLFGTQAFVKTATGPQSTGHLKRGYGEFTYYISGQEDPPQITSIVITKGLTLGSHPNNYNLTKSSIFSGLTSNFGLFCASDPSLSVGLNDRVTIQNPPQGIVAPGIGLLQNNTYILTPGSPANFYAKFVSGSTPITEVNTYDWSLVLYRSNGEEYEYAATSWWPNIAIQYMNNDFYWQPSLGVLPAYDWLYDPNGYIYGKIRTTVNISDGDTKSDETTIAVCPYQTIENQVYNSNTTINACASLKLNNVTISGSPTVIINANGLGATINGLFEMPIGATLIVNP